MPNRHGRSKRGHKPIFTEAQKRALAALIATGLRKQFKRLRKGLYGCHFGLGLFMAADSP